MAQIYELARYWDGNFDIWGWFFLISSFRHTYNIVLLLFFSKQSKNVIPCTTQKTAVVTFRWWNCFHFLRVLLLLKLHCFECSFDWCIILDPHSSTVMKWYINSFWLCLHSSKQPLKHYKFLIQYKQARHSSCNSFFTYNIFNSAPVDIPTSSAILSTFTLQ